MLSNLTDQPVDAAERVISGDAIDLHLLKRLHRSLGGPKGRAMDAAEQGADDVSGRQNVQQDISFYS